MQHLFSSFLRFWLIPLTGGSLVLLSALPAIPQMTRPQAQAVTVRIDRPSEPGIAAAGGSGVLVKQEGDRYSVLTNCHVIKDNPGTYTLWINENDRYSVLVPKPSRRCHSRVDLAVLTFTSTQRYSIATLRPERDIDVLVNEATPITAAGFPNSYDGSATRSGLIFDPRGGSLLQPRKGDPDGYELVHSIPTQDGMSGGPIFDAEGKLIAINGETLRSNTGRAETYYYAAIPIHYYTDWPQTTEVGFSEFYCDMSGAEPMTVAVHPRFGPRNLIVWRSEFWSSRGLTPERRCSIVSNRLNNLAERDELKFLTTSRKNGEQVVCAQIEIASPDCETILTVEPTENAQDVLKVFLGIRLTEPLVR